MPGRAFKGRVLSKKQAKGCVVTVVRRKRDPHLGKIYTREKKFHVHDEYDQASVGDLVVFRESRPYSKLKHWVLESIESHPAASQVEKERESV